MAEDNLDPQVDNQDPTIEVTSETTPDWKTGLDVGIKDHPALQNFKSPADLAKSWISAQALIGKEKIPVPGEKATKEDWDTVFTRLGRPENSDGYAIPDYQVPDGYPEVPPEFIKEFKDKALELGMLPNQVNGLYEWFMGNQTNQFSQMAEERNQGRLDGETNLRKQWGKAFEQNLALGEKALDAYGDDQLKQELKAAGITNSPAMITFLSKVGKNLSEDKLEGRPLGLTKSPEEAITEINKIKGEALTDKNHAYNNKQHPEHDALVTKMNNLFKMAYPDSA